MCFSNQYQIILGGSIMIPIRNSRWLLHGLCFWSVSVRGAPGWSALAAPMWVLAIALAIDLGPPIELRPPCDFAAVSALAGNGDALVHGAGRFRKNVLNCSAQFVCRV